MPRNAARASSSAAMAGSALLGSASAGTRACSAPRRRRGAAATEAFGAVASGRIASTARGADRERGRFVVDARREARLRAQAEREADRRRLRLVALARASVPRTCTASSIALLPSVEPRLRAQHRAVAHQRQRAVALGLRRAQRRRQRVVVVERALGELADDVEPADRLELEVEVVEQVDDELLRLAARRPRPSAASARPALRLPARASC